MLLFIALAGALIPALYARRQKLVDAFRRRPAATGAVILAGVALLLLDLVLRESFPEAARILRGASTLALLTIPFLLVRLAFAERTRDTLLVAVAWIVLATVTTAHGIRDLSWHQTELALGERTIGVEQEILFSTGAWNRLRAATQSFVLFDIHAPAGDLESARVKVSDRTYPGKALFAAMPPMGESTTAGGRNPRRYRQWWALPLEPDALPRDSRSLNISLTYEAGPAISLFGDRFRDAGRVYEGPSFGDWPNVAAPKLEYDGDYRLPVRRTLDSQGTRSYLLERDGTRFAIRDVLRIRVVTLQSNEAHFRWRIAPPLEKPAAAVGFFARSQGSAMAELLVDDEPVLRFPLGTVSDFQVEDSGYRLCHQAQGLRGEHAYGGYVLALPARRSEPFTLMTRYRSGMSLRPLLFRVDPEGEAASLEALAEKCGGLEGELLAGGAEIDTASRNSYPEDTGRWSVAEVY
jgi:hypothetical protein